MRSSTENRISWMAFHLIYKHKSSILLVPRRIGTKSKPNTGKYISFTLFWLQYGKSKYLLLIRIENRGKCQWSAWRIRKLECSWCRWLEEIPDFTLRKTQTGIRTCNRLWCRCWPSLQRSSSQIFCKGINLILPFTKRFKSKCDSIRLT